MATGMRPAFAWTHLESAAVLARRAHALERALDLPATLTERDAYILGYARDRRADERYSEHRAYVIGAIFAAVAAMDAGVSACFVSAHEIWLDAKKVRHQGGASSITERQEKLAMVWDDPRFQRRNSMFDRAKEAPRLAETATHDVPSWATACEMTTLRNFLTHYSGGIIWTASTRPERPVSPPHAMDSCSAKTRCRRRHSGTVSSSPIRIWAIPAQPGPSQQPVASSTSSPTR